MIVADWVAIGLVALFILVGLIAGFGHGLKFFTSGIFGVIISIIVCYLLGGLILQAEFVQALLAKLIEAMTDKNGFCDFLIKIHIDIVVYYVALFIVVQILRIIIVLILKSIVEVNNPFFIFLNKFLGMVLMLAVLTAITLVVFQVAYWIGDSTAESFSNFLSGSVFKLDKLFANNPINSLVEYVKG
jgi:hypothetical protein